MYIRLRVACLQQDINKLSTSRMTLRQSANQIKPKHAKTRTETFILFGTYKYVCLCIEKECE